MWHLTRNIKCLAFLAQIIAVAVLLFWAAPAMAERRTALVIGNSAYSKSPLPNTLNDARDMTAVLKRLGFKVIGRMDASQKEMQRAIIEFGRELEKGGVGLFYYAGHAVQLRDRNYMIPVGAQITSSHHVEPESVDLYKVIGRMAGARNKMNIVILDACRDNPFKDFFQIYSEGLAQMRAPARSYIAYAAGPGGLAADGTGRNSFYTGALLKTLEEPGVSIEKVFKNVRSAVIKKTKGLQVPWTSSSITEDFYFRPKAVAKVAPSKGKAIDREVVFWQSVFQSKNREDFEAYLTQFPKGIFVPLARNKLKTLPRVAANSAPAKPANPVVAGTLSDPRVLDAIDETMEDERSKGASYIEQVDAAVTKLKSIRQRLDADKKATEEQSKKVALAKAAAEKRYKARLAEIRAEEEKEHRRAREDAKKAAAAKREKILAEAQRRATMMAEKTVAGASQRAERVFKEALQTAQGAVEASHKKSIAAAEEKAAAAHKAAMARAEKKAALLRKQIMDRAKKLADKARQNEMMAARRAADRTREQGLAAAEKQTVERRTRDVAAARAQAAKLQEKLLESAKKQADAAYEKRLAEALRRADTERKKRIAGLEAAATAERDRKMAIFARISGEKQKKPARAVPVKAKTVAVATPTSDVTPELRKTINTAILSTRGKGGGRDAQIRAALDAVKKLRKEEKSQEDVPSNVAILEAARMNPAMRRAIERAMRKARADGKDYAGQVRAALSAIKSYRRQKKPQ
jgi:hypothetical protein